METSSLALWWLPAAGILAGLALAATDHMLRATVVLAASLVAGALIRAALPIERAGGLCVRRRWVDVAILLALAVAITVIGFSLDLTALV